MFSAIALIIYGIAYLLKGIQKGGLCRQQGLE